MKYKNPQDLLSSLIHFYYETFEVSSILECVTDDIYWIGSESSNGFTIQKSIDKPSLENWLKNNIPTSSSLFKIDIFDEQKISDFVSLVNLRGTREFIDNKKLNIRLSVSFLCVSTDNGWLIKNIHESNQRSENDKNQLKKELSFIQKKEEMLLSGIPGGVAIYRLKKDGRVATEYVSDGLAKICGYDSGKEFGEYLKYNSLINLVQEDVPELMQVVAKALELNTSINTNYRIYTKDKQTIRIRLDANFMTNETLAEDDVAVAYAVHTLVSQDSLKIIDEQKRYRMVIEQMNACVFEWNLKDGTFYSSEAYKNYAVSQVDTNLILQNKGPIDIVHPEDIDQLQSFFKQSEAKLPTAEAVLRLKMTDGSFHWCRMLGFFYYDKNGQPERTVGVVIDINQEHEQSFMLNNLINDLPGGVAILKLAKKIECNYFSDGFAEILGCSRAEVESHFENDNLFQNIMFDDDYKDFLSKLKTQLNGGEKFNKNYMHKSFSGNISWFHISATKINEENGCPIFYVIFTNPSTETQLYRNIVEDSSMGVILAEVKGNKAIFINEMAKKICGLADSTYSNEKLFLNISKKLSADYLLKAQDYKSLQMDKYSEFHISVENSYYSVTAKRLVWNDIDSYILYITDETSEQKEQIELQELIDKVPAGIGIYEINDTQVSLIFLNNAYYSMLKLKREERVHYYGNRHMNAVHPDDVKIMQNVVKQFIDGENFVTASFRTKNGNGEWTWVGFVGSVIERKEKFIRIYSSYNDCDDIMKAQFELNENSVMLNAAMESAKVRAWKYDFKNDRILNGTSSSFFKTEKTVNNALQSILNHNYVLESSIEDFKWLFAHVGDGKVISKDIQVRNSDNQIGWSRIIYTPIFGVDGNCTEAIGTEVDITEQKEREQRYMDQLHIKKMSAENSVGAATYNLSENRITEIYTQDGEFQESYSLGSVDEALKYIRDSAYESERKSLMHVYDCKALLKAFDDGISHMEIKHHMKGDNRCFKISFDILKNPFTEDIEAMVICRDITKAVLLEMIINNLIDIDYDYVMTIDLNTNTVTPFETKKSNEYFEKLIAPEISNETTDGCLQKFIGKYAVESCKEKALADNKCALIRSKLLVQSIYESVFSVEIDKKLYRVRAIYSYLDKDTDLIFCAVQDITETYKIEEAQKKDLEEALRVAEKANQSKTEFFSRMSHDMRTPMNGILGLAELSENESDVKILKSNLAQIKDSGLYLLSLINDTLDFQRIESGKLTLNNKIINTGEVFTSLVDMLRLSAQSKNIKFNIINEDAHMDVYVSIDPIRLKQIFVNLVSNAIKFTDFGGTINMYVKNLGRDGALSHNCVIIEDTGIGMSEDFIKNRLFKPFEQEQSKVTSQYAGSGLGLSIVYKLVEMMGGHIEVESKVGVGTKFSVFLDCVLIDPEIAKKEILQQTKIPVDFKKNLSEVKILLVEDHPLNAEIAKRLLANAGCKDIVWADNGQKGVEAFEKSKLNDFDIVLMDIRMPVMNGLEATTEIRKLNRPDAKTIPIIAMTANAYAEDVESALKVGMNAHLAKPIEPRLLYETISEFVKNTD